MTNDQIAELEEAHRNWCVGEWLVGDDGSGNGLSALYREKLFDPECLIAKGLDDSDAALARLAVNALPRLLEERRRLLEALRPFAEGANAMTFRKMMYEAGLEHVVKETQAAADAIAFAEEPTTAPRVPPPPPESQE